MGLLGILRQFIAKVQPSYKNLQSKADDRIPEVELAFLLAVEKLKAAVHINSDPDIRMMDKNIDWTILEEELEKHLFDIVVMLVYEGGYQASLDMQKTSPVKKTQHLPTMSYGFNVGNPASVRWAQQYTAKVVRGISDESRSAISAIIVNAIQFGLSPRDVARQIQEYIGLTERQVKALLAYQRALDDSGRSIRDIDNMVDSRIRKMIRQRANMIARTETIRAINEGQQIHWQDMLDKGFLRTELQRKTWIVTPDDRLCSICAAMQDETAEIDKPFSFGGTGPPRHPSCRCAMGLVDTAPIE